MPPKVPTYHGHEPEHRGRDLQGKAAGGVGLLRVLAAARAGVVQVLGDGGALGVHEELNQLAFVQHGLVGRDAVPLPQPVLDFAHLAKKVVARGIIQSGQRLACLLNVAPS